MAAFNVGPGSLTENFSTEEIPVGTRREDPQTGKIYIFLKNVGATAIAANEVAKATDVSVFTCELSDTMSDEDFAGIRVSSATSLAQNEWGWFQVRGNCTIKSNGAATNVVKGEAVQTSGTNGKIEGVDVTVVAEALAKIGVGRAASTGSTSIEVQLTYSIWG